MKVTKSKGKVHIRASKGHHLTTKVRHRGTYLWDRPGNTIAVLAHELGVSRREASMVTNVLGHLLKRETEDQRKKLVAPAKTITQMQVSPALQNTYATETYNEMLERDEKYLAATKLPDAPYKPWWGRRIWDYFFNAEKFYRDGAA